MAGHAAPQRSARGVPRLREHHVTKDYRYVRRDLVGIGAIGAVVLAFIVVMSFIV